jgi:PilZ domain
MDQLATHEVLAQARVTWGESAHLDAVVLHAAPTMLVLEAAHDAHLPEPGTAVEVDSQSGRSSGRLAEHGRGGRFLVSLGERPVRRSARLRVSLPATLRSPALSSSQLVELADLTTGGARIRGVELPVGTQVTLDFTPPSRTDPVTVRAAVAHGTHNAARPWIGVTFRLVAMRGSRS